MRKFATWKTCCHNLVATSKRGWPLLTQRRVANIRPWDRSLQHLSSMEIPENLRFRHCGNLSISMLVYVEWWKVGHQGKSYVVMTQHFVGWANNDHSSGCSAVGGTLGYMTEQQRGSLTRLRQFLILWCC